MTPYGSSEVNKAALLVFAARSWLSETRWVQYAQGHVEHLEEASLRALFGCLNSLRDLPPAALLRMTDVFAWDDDMEDVMLRLLSSLERADPRWRFPLEIQLPDHGYTAEPDNSVGQLLHLLDELLAPKPGCGER